MSICCGCIRIGHITGRMGEFFAAWIFAWLAGEVLVSWGQRWTYVRTDYGVAYGRATSWCIENSSILNDAASSFCMEVWIGYAMQAFGYAILALIGMLVRRKVIARYGIHEEPCTSAAIACCCASCNLCQMGAQVDISEFGTMNACNIDF